MNNKISTLLLVTFVKLCWASSFNLNRSSDSHTKNSNISSFIVGGVNAYPHEFPSMIHINAAGTLCGGTLVDSGWVLTTATCTGPDQPAAYVLTAGAHNFSQPDGTEQTLQAAYIFVHPNYDPTRFPAPNNIALIKLAKPVTLTDTVQPIPLASPGPDVQAPMVGTAIGWGRLSVYGQPSTILQKVKLFPISNAECQNSYGGYSIECTMACYGGLGAGVCIGDAGGPLIGYDADNAQFLFGVTSDDFDCAQTDHPSLFASIPSYRFWIETTIADNTYALINKVV